MPFERRRKPRFKPAGEETWQIWLPTPAGAERPVPARLIDSSGDGAGMDIDEAVPVGTAVGITGGGQTARRAKVIRCCRTSSRTYRLGIAFIRDEPSQQPAGITPEGTSDYYETLEISPNASFDTIHRVYRILAQRYHPDNQDTGDETAFRQLLAAYRALSDPESRAAYDVRRRSAVKDRWKIFDRAEAAQGADRESGKRRGILSLLYRKRVAEPSRPGMNVRDFEELLGCPREHLEFSLWYLRENALITCGDNGLFAITVKGVDHIEAPGPAQPVCGELLLAARRE